MKILKKVFNERNLVVILFVMVMVTFSFAQKESEKMDKMYYGFKIRTASPYVSADIKHPIKPTQAEKAKPSPSIN
ncbi:MAG: hypothetical protein WDO19_09110 [Bacteroidota bacterium]